jgi:hypothetical protein
MVIEHMLMILLKHVYINVQNHHGHIHKIKQENVYLDVQKINLVKIKHVNVLKIVLNGVHLLIILRLIV